MDHGLNNSSHDKYEKQDLIHLSNQARELLAPECLDTYFNPQYSFQCGIICSFPKHLAAHYRDREDN